MKKLILTITAVVGASFAAYSQGQVGMLNDDASGYVVIDTNGHLSASTSSYTQSASFTAQLWALSGPTSSTSGLTGLDAYGYLAPGNLLSDGFALVPGSTVSNGGNGTGGVGAFEGVTVSVTGTTSGNTVLAVVCWTGGYASFGAAVAAGAACDLGILAYVNAVGPASPTPYGGDISDGWNALTECPAAVANGAGGNDLIMAPVPEPTTMALVGLGGLGLLLFRRRQ